MLYSHKSPPLLAGSSVCRPPPVAQVWVIDPELTAWRENAVRVSGDAISVLVVIPELPGNMNSEEILEFAARTFCLHGVTPLNGRHARVLQASAFQEGRAPRCVQIEMGIQDAKLRSISLTSVSDFSIENLQDQRVSGDPLLRSALTTFVQCLEKREKEAYGLHGKSGFELEFGLLHTHAYRLAHQFLSQQRVPHLYHSEDDNYRYLKLGYAEPESQKIEKAPFGSPLRKLVCFVNLIQLTHTLLHGRAAFAAEQLRGLSDGVNEVRKDLFSMDRKWVITSIVRNMLDGPLELQTPYVRDRISVLHEHLARSAPLPKDALRLLLTHTNIPEVRKKVIEHALKNPRYAHALLALVNQREWWFGKRYQIKESVDFEKGELKLALRTWDRVHKTEEREEIAVPLTSFYEDLHTLRIKALQKLSGYSSKIELEKPFLPHNWICTNDRPVLLEFVENDLAAAFEKLEIIIDQNDFEKENLCYRRLMLRDRFGREEHFETVPLAKDLPENDVAALTEMINWYVAALEKRGHKFQNLVARIQERRPEVLRQAGIDISVMTASHTYSPKTKVVSGKWELELRLIGNPNEKLKRLFSFRIDPMELQLGKLQGLKTSDFIKARIEGEGDEFLLASAKQMKVFENDRHFQ